MDLKECPWNMEKLKSCPEFVLYGSQTTKKVNIE